MSLKDDSKVDEVADKTSKTDRIRVAIRVRPFLNKEYNKDEVVYCDSK